VAGHAVLALADTGGADVIAASRVLVDPTASVGVDPVGGPKQGEDHDDEHDGDHACWLPVSGWKHLPSFKRAAPCLSVKVAAMPFTRMNLKADLEDVGSNFDGAPDLEFRLATKALELEQSGLSYQRIPPNYRFPYGHTHQEQEELYVVVRGSGRMKLDDEIVDVGEWDVVRVPPGTWRGYEAGPEGLEILVVGAPNLGEDPRGDVEGRRDWWAD
jgi:mannose-6-phosphate isomerase-like protein (cupin superfamily)